MIKNTAEIIIQYFCCFVVPLHHPAMHFDRANTNQELIRKASEYSKEEKPTTEP